MKRLLLFGLLLFLSNNITAQGWDEIQKIVPDDRFTGQQFGATVDIDGNYAVVGVLASNSAKDAYVYENNGSGNWMQLQKLESPNFNQFDHFGTAVAISGDYIFVGAWGQSYDANEPTLSTSENSTENMLNVYPNLTQRELHVDLKQLQEKVSISTVNVLGQEVLKASYGLTSQIDINLEGLRNGLYLASLRTDRINIQTIKIVKE